MSNAGNTPNSGTVLTTINSTNPARITDADVAEGLVAGQKFVGMWGTNLNVGVTFVPISQVALAPPTAGAAYRISVASTNVADTSRVIEVLSLGQAFTGVYGASDDDSPWQVETFTLDAVDPTIPRNGVVDVGDFYCARLVGGGDPVGDIVITIRDEGQGSPAGDEVGRILAGENRSRVDRLTIPQGWVGVIEADGLQVGWGGDQRADWRLISLNGFTGLGGVVRGGSVVASNSNIPITNEPIPVTAGHTVGLSGRRAVGVGDYMDFQMRVRLKRLDDSVL